ncbi:MAG: dephospho-CoA kinase [Prevotella sp.]|nr:dephospho-CoA kinase [Prevotella sp.]
MENVNVKIAVTGGIGSGKSFVCRRLVEHGFNIFDCDASAKRLMRESEDVRRGLIDLVGEDAYINGKLNKAAIANFLMTSDDNTSRLNAVVHPAVAKDFLSSGCKWMECAILFESGFNQYVDKVICVAAPLEVRINRVMQRDGIDRDKVLEWMGKQWPQEKVVALSDYVIVNDGIEDVDEQLLPLLDMLYPNYDGNDDRFFPFMG